MTYMVMVELRRIREIIYLAGYGTKYPEALYKDRNVLARNLMDYYVSLF